MRHRYREALTAPEPLGGDSRIQLSDTMGSPQSIMVEGEKFLGTADTRLPDVLAKGVE